MRWLKKLLRDRRGISMTEVIVAMAMVTIVTGAAISVLVASMQFDIKYQEKTAALSYCESAVECVRFAEDKEMLKQTLNLIQEGFGDFQNVDSSDVFSLTEGDTVIQVVVTSNAGTDNYVVKLNDEVIYEISK